MNNFKLNVKTADEIMGETRPELVVIKNNTVHFVGLNYYIGIDRITTRAKLIEWIHHLCGKVWVTPEILEQFIGRVCAYRKWRIYE